ncbi:MAG: D-alanyl-D-alanine carboxypeptidase family protein [Hungatella sp.]
MRRFLIAAITVIFLSVLLTQFPAYAKTDEKKEDDLKLYAQSAVLIDAASGRILYGKEEEIPRPMASTTKIMTCILALEQGNLRDEVSVSSYAAGQPKVHLGAAAKEAFYLEDLLYSLMLESHNDTAVMLAEHIGGTVQGFAKMMNQKAAEIGCRNTYFITPNGLDAVEQDAEGAEHLHSTTAGDLARMMRYCVWESPKKERFQKITQTQDYGFSNLTGTRSYQCRNHNAFLSMMSGVLSGKTGFTGGAGYSYVAALEDGERKFAIALLGCGWPPHKTYKWSDAKRLFSYGLDHYEYCEVYQEKLFKPVAVEHGIAKTGKIGQQAYAGLSLRVTKEEKSLRLLMKAGERVRVVYEVPKKLEAPVRAGMAVGRVTYYLEQEKVREYPIYTTDAIGKITWFWCLQKTIASFLSLSGMLY